MNINGVVPNLRPDPKKSPLNSEQIVQLKCEARERRQNEAANPFSFNKLITPYLHHINSNAQNNSNDPNKPTNKASFCTPDDALCHSFSETTPTPPSDIMIANTTKKTSLLDSFANFKSNVLCKKIDENDYYPCLGLELKPQSANSKVTTVKLSSSSTDALNPNSVSTFDSTSLPKTKTSSSTSCESSSEKMTSTMAANNNDVITSIDTSEKCNQHSNNECNKPHANANLEIPLKRSNSPNLPTKCLKLTPTQISPTCTNYNTTIVSATLDHMCTTQIPNNSPASEISVSGVGDAEFNNAIPNIDGLNQFDSNVNQVSIFGNVDPRQLNADKTKSSPISPGSVLAPIDKAVIEQHQPGATNFLTDDNAESVSITNNHVPSSIELDNNFDKSCFEKDFVASNHLTNTKLEPNPIDNDSLFAERYDQIDVKSIKDNQPDLNLDEFVGVNTPMTENDLEMVFNLFSAGNIKSDFLISQLPTDSKAEDKMICSNSNKNDPSLMNKSVCNLPTSQNDRPNSSNGAKADNSTSNLLNDCFSMVMGNMSPSFQKNKPPPQDQVVSVSAAITPTPNNNNKARHGRSSARSKRSGSAKTSAKRPPQSCRPTRNSSRAAANTQQQQMIIVHPNNANYASSSIPNNYSNVLPNQPCIVNHHPQQRDAVDNDRNSINLSVNNTYGLNRYPQQYPFDSESLEQLMCKGIIPEQVRHLAPTTPNNPAPTLSQPNNDNNTDSAIRHWNVNFNTMDKFFQMFANDIEGQIINLGNGITVPLSSDNIQLYLYLKQLVYVIISRNHSGTIHVSEIRRLIQVLHTQLNVPNTSIDAHKMAIYHHILFLLTNFCDSCENQQSSHVSAGINSFANDTMTNNSDSSIMSMTNPTSTNPNMVRSNANAPTNMSGITAPFPVFDGGTHSSANNINNTNIPGIVGSSLITPSDGFVHNGSQHLSTTINQQSYNNLLSNQVTRQPTSFVPTANNNPNNVSFTGTVNREQALAAAVASQNSYNSNQPILPHQMIRLNKVINVPGDRSNNAIPNNMISQNEVSRCSVIPNNVNNNLSSESFNQVQQIAQFARQQQLYNSINNSCALNKQQYAQRLVNVPNNSALTAVNFNSPSAAASLQNVQIVQNSRGSAMGLNEFSSTHGNNITINTNPCGLPNGKNNNNNIRGGEIFYGGDINNHIRNVNDVYRTFAPGQQQSGRSFVTQNQPNQQYHLNSMADNINKNMGNVSENINSIRANKVYTLPSESLPNNNGSAYVLNPACINQSTNTTNSQFSTPKSALVVPNHGFLLNNSTCGGLPSMENVANISNGISHNTSDMYCLPDMKHDRGKDWRNYMGMKHIQTLANVGGANNFSDISNIAQNSTNLSNSFVIEQNMAQIPSNMHQNSAPPNMYTNTQIVMQSSAPSHNLDNNFTKPISIGDIQSGNVNCNFNNINVDNFSNDNSHSNNSQSFGVLPIFMGPIPPREYEQYGAQIPSSAWHNLQCQYEFETIKRLQGANFHDDKLINHLRNVRKRLESFVNLPNVSFFDRSSNLPQ